MFQGRSRDLLNSVTVNFFILCIYFRYSHSSYLDRLIRYITASFSTQFELDEVCCTVDSTMSSIFFYYHRYQGVDDDGDGNGVCIIIL